MPESTPTPMCRAVVRDGTVTLNRWCPWLEDAEDLRARAHGLAGRDPSAPTSS